MISIIIPTLNEEKRIERALLSLRNLKAFEYEIIVSDGGSTDKTIEIAQKYADKVLRWKDKKRQTIGEGRNVGAAQATGGFYVFIDADVIIPDIDTFFSSALSLFETDKKLVALTVFLKVFPESATLADKFFFGTMNLYYYLLNTFFHIGAAAGEFQMITAEAFEKTKGYNVTLAAGEDNELFSRLSRIGHTRAEAGLHVFHSSRRAQAIGWPHLLFLWFMNSISAKLFKKSFSKVWNPIRD